MNMLIASHLAGVVGESFPVAEVSVEVQSALAESHQVAGGLLRLEEDFPVVVDSLLLAVEDCHLVEGSLVAEGNPLVAVAVEDSHRAAEGNPLAVVVVEGNR